MSYRSKNTDNYSLRHIIGLRDDENDQYGQYGEEYNQYGGNYEHGQYGGNYDGVDASEIEKDLHNIYRASNSYQNKIQEVMEGGARARNGRRSGSKNRNYSSAQRNRNDPTQKKKKDPNAPPKKINDTIALLQKITTILKTNSKTKIEHVEFMSTSKLILDEIKNRLKIDTITSQVEKDSLNEARENAEKYVQLYLKSPKYAERLKKKEARAKKYQNGGCY